VVYQGVLDEEFVALHPLLGSARADELKQKIWEIQQAPKPEES
jgi:prephenate dehydrogenase